MTRFRYSIAVSTLHDRDAVARITAPVRAVLDGLGGTATDDPAGDPLIPHVVVVATGGTERAVLDVVGRRRAAVPWEPVVLVAHPLHNSLPAALETLARLRRDDVAGQIVQLPEQRSVATAVGDLTVLHRLRTTRVGLVGTPSEWLVASVPNAASLRSRWGIELVDVDITATIDRYRSGSLDAGRPVAVRFSGRGEVGADTLAAAALHPAIVASIASAGVDAVAVRCFDFLTELSTSGCIALAELNDRGVVAGCEGDVASTVAMLLVRTVLDRPSWIANPAVIDAEADRIVLAHCTVAPSMVRSVELHTHFESGIGVGLRGSFEPGPVTLLRLGGEALERHWFADAAVVATGDSPDMCRTQVTVEVMDQPVRALLEDPLGNHLVMVRGHHRDRLAQWWRLAFGDR